MNKIWSVLSNFSTLITVIPVAAGVTVSVLTYLDKFDGRLQFIAILMLLVFILAISIWIAHKLYEMNYPKKPRVIKSFDKPDTYIFYNGVWRKIPDWQTRDYLAHILGFRPGEEDIEEVSPEFIRQIKVGKSLESIFTYSR